MPGQITLSTRAWLRNQANNVKLLLSNFTNLNTMLTELFTDHTVTFHIPVHASQTTYSFFTARRGFTVVGVDVVPNLAQGSALTATVVKATGTAAPAAGTTPLHTGTANLNATAHTVQALTLHGTASNLVLANGDRLGVVLSAALSTGMASITVRMRRT